MSKRGIAAEKAVVLFKSGLGGSPVGMLEDANALRPNGLRPLIGSIRPADVNNPILIRSRRETCPWEFALIMSHRSLRACSASRKRAFEAFGDKKKFLSDIVSRYWYTNLQWVLAESGTVGAYVPATRNPIQIQEPPGVTWLCVS